ncbi:MAG: M50 family metallopeptidase [Dehalococcoidia bacterium]
MRGTIQIGRVLGIPIGVHFSWFLLLSAVMGVLAIGIYPEALPEESAWVYWLLAAISGLLLFACIVLHELGHSVVARYFGIPVRSITLFVLGGVAQITRDAKRPLPELLMALAGPAVSILLGGVFMVLWWFTGQGTNAASTMWGWLWISNIGLGIFNLVPAFPMDGGRVLRASIWGVTRNFSRATRIAVWIARLFAWTLMGVGVLAALESRFLPEEISPITGVQLLLIGFFLLQYAGTSLRQTLMLDELARHPVRDVMVQGIPAVYLQTTAREMLDGPLAGYGPGRDWAFVSGGDRFAGIVPRVAAERVPEDLQGTCVAADLMIPVAALQPIDPADTLADALQHFQEHEVHLLPVVDDGQVIGLIHDGHIARALRSKAA